MSIDVLSDVLRAVRLTGAVYFSVDATAPFAAEAPPGRQVGPFVLPGVEHVLEYHLITQGSCWGGIVGEEPVQLQEGDIIAFPHGDAHVISSSRGMRGPTSLDTYKPRPGSQLPFSLREQGGGGARTHLVCAFVGCDLRPFNPLLSTLPRTLKVSTREGGGWLEALARLAVTESEGGRTGGETVLARASELMFVEVVRRHLASLPPEQTGWLAGLRDPFVGRALAALHDRPAEAWTVESLAKEVALSRSALAERFTHLVGEAPMQYLTRWRMQRAGMLLRTRNVSVFEAAMDVGYASEAAFSRAFKKVVGIPPSAWRQREPEPASLPRAGAR
ncbi:MAG TPA: AraC family transcriptional regulator [Myxococcaceae bacterium]|nr:AraC family transcriptional regulator [Myxococcaceae bacterium]